MRNITNHINISPRACGRSDVAPFPHTFTSTGPLESCAAAAATAAAAAAAPAVDAAAAAAASALLVGYHLKLQHLKWNRPRENFQISRKKKYCLSEQLCC